MESKLELNNIKKLQIASDVTSDLFLRNSDIQYCGICHTDIHQVRDEWGAHPYVKYRILRVFKTTYVI
jgi:hypothetical protein